MTCHKTVLSGKNLVKWTFSKLGDISVYFLESFPSIWTPAEVMACIGPLQVCQDY